MLAAKPDKRGYRPYGFQVTGKATYQDLATCRDKFRSGRNTLVRMLRRILIEFGAKRNARNAGKPCGKFNVPKMPKRFRRRPGRAL